MNGKSPSMDAFLGERLKKYNQWFDAGSVDYTARVIPVGESLGSRKWVMSTDQATAVLKSAETIALNPCVCRSHYKRCDSPVEVCMLFDHYGRRFIEKGLAREIAYEEAVCVLEHANAHGLVHLSLYRPNHQLYALCSCCACCCHDLQLFLQFNETRLVCRSDYIADTDQEDCMACGQCIERCVFGARTSVNGGTACDPDRCYGCGLCVSTCPAGAIRMQHKGTLPPH